MSTASLFPTSLYTTDANILDVTLTQSEFQQVAVEVEQIEAALGTSPQGTSATVAARFSGLMTAGTTVAFTALTGTISAAQHGTVATAGTHAFSGLTGTFVATQHGALGTAATHDFSGLTGTFVATQHGALGTASTHPFSSITGVLTSTQGGGAGGATSFSALSSSLGSAQTFSSAGAIYSFGGVNARSFQATFNATLSIVPVANTANTTFAAFDVRGNATTTNDTRVFLGHFGLDVTAGTTTGGGDRVALYAGLFHSSGSAGGCWTINSVIAIGSNASTSGAHFGYELDYNNASTHYGEVSGAGGLGVANYGLAISGAGPYRAVAAMLISGPQTSTGQIWNRGIIIPRYVVQQASIQDLGSAITLDVLGSPEAVINVAGGTPDHLIRSGVIAPISFFGNLNMGSTASHPSATETLKMSNGGAPTTAITDAIQIYSQDSSSGATAPAFFIEQAIVTAAAAAGTGATYEVKVRWNGNEYWMLMRSA